MRSRPDEDQPHNSIMCRLTAEGAVLHLLAGVNPQALQQGGEPLDMEAAMQLIEYRVRPVTRYIVTRFEQDGRMAGGSGHGEFDNEETAYAVGYALCKAEHDKLGWPAFDERIQYPRRLSEETAKPCQPS